MKTIVVKSYHGAACNQFCIHKTADGYSYDSYGFNAPMVKDWPRSFGYGGCGSSAKTNNINDVVDVALWVNSVRHLPCLLSDDLITELASIGYNIVHVDEDRDWVASLCVKCKLFTASIQGSEMRTCQLGIYPKYDMVITCDKMQVA